MPGNKIELAAGAVEEETMLHLYWVVVRKGTNHAFAAFLCKKDAEEYIIRLGEFGINYEIKSMESYLNDQH